MSAWASYPFPFSNVMSLRVAGRVRGAHRQDEDVPAELTASYLIGTCPGFVPGNIDVVDDLVSLNRVRARVREHRVVERHSLIVRWSGIGRHCPTVRSSDHLHATVG